MTNYKIQQEILLWRTKAYKRYLAGKLSDDEKKTWLSGSHDNKVLAILNSACCFFIDKKEWYLSDNVFLDDKKFTPEMVNKVLELAQTKGEVVKEYKYCDSVLSVIKPEKGEPVCVNKEYLDFFKGEYNTILCAEPHQPIVLINKQSGLFAYDEIIGFIAPVRPKEPVKL